MKKKSAEGGGVKARIFLIIAAILAIVLLAAAASYSWMYEGTRGTVAAFWNEVVNISEFEMQMDDGEWSSIIMLDIPDTKLRPVCGNVANMKFYTAELEEEEQRVSPTLSIYTLSRVGSLSQITGSNLDNYVITLQTQLRSSGACNVKLSPSCSFGLPPERIDNNGSGGTSSDGTTTADPFANADRDVYGSYGALRLAVLVDDVLKAVWIPNPNYEFDYLSGQLTTNGEIEENYKVVNGTNYYSSDRVDIPTSDEGYYIYNGVPYIWDLEKAPSIFEMTGGSEGLSVTLVIWFDGTDRECANLTSGGTASLYLSFVADYSTND